jgi:uncharacterized protein YkvS
MKLNELRKILATMENGDDYAAVIREVKAAHKRLQKQVTTNLSIGDTVRFDAKTRGIIQGVITKINTKTIVVDAGAMTWKVTPSLVEKVAA